MEDREWEGGQTRQKWAEWLQNQVTKPLWPPSGTPQARFCQLSSQSDTRPGGAANGILFTSVLLDPPTTLHLQVASRQDGCEPELEARREPRASTSTDLHGFEHCFQQTRTLMDQEIWGESSQLYASAVAFLHSMCIISQSKVKRDQTHLPCAEQGQPSCHTTYNLLLSRWPALSWRSPSTFSRKH